MATDISRRLFLRSTAAASAALATVSAPIVAEASQQEHPTLLRIREELPAAVREWQEAEQQRRASRARFAEIAPQLPDELVAGRNALGGLDHYQAEREVDCELETVWPTSPDGKTCSSPRMIYSSAAIERSSYPFNHHPKSSKQGKYCRRIHRMAKDYEEAFEAARQSSGVVDALKHLYSAVDRLRRMASDACEIPPHSLTGLVIKADVMMAYAGCDGEAAAWAVSYARRMPADVVALFGSDRSVGL